MKKTISISEWHQLAESGYAPPVRIRLNGNSMYPLVRMNRDYVTVAPIEKTPDIGDIVMFCEPGTSRYVAHRVWEIKDEMVQTWGDNCPKPDAWISMKAVWGKVILIERGKRRIQPDPAKGIRLAKFWHPAGKIYRLGKRYTEAVIRRIKKLRSRGSR